MIIKAFITHKMSENFADCQDRFGVNADTKSVAVSDGMGSTWQPKIWARLLVDEFIGNEKWLPDINSIKPLCRKWQEEVNAFIANLKETNAPEYLINMNELNLVKGRSAGATFVGIRFNEKKWSGSVLGDSCLIEWNGHDAKFHTSQNVEAFDYWPDYFDSNVLNEGKGAPKLIDGILADGDCLLLVSDPLSDFLLKNYNQGHKWQYISQLLGISSHEEFETLVAKWRKDGMHNDDTTLVIVENDGANDFSIVALDNLDILIEKDRLEKEKKQEINIGEQVVSQKEQVKEKKEVSADSNYISTPDETDIVINELRNELKEKEQSLEKRSLMGWWNIIQKAHRKVLEKYVISKK